MEIISAGFWGAFFGTVCLMLAAALAAFLRSLQRVALTAAGSGLMTALFVAIYLGLLPVGDERGQARLLALVAVLTSVVLGLMLLAMLGLLRRMRRQALAALLGPGAIVLVVCWLLPPERALALGSAFAFGVGAISLVVCVRAARRGDRLAWVAVLGVVFMQGALLGLSWIALHVEVTPWPVHAATALSAIAFLVTMAVAMWGRYAYLLELREVMAMGPSYDPVTRMRSHEETGQLVGTAFTPRVHQGRPVGVIAVCLGNLYALENLHGRSACNHALFVTASRLRRAVPPGMEAGRLGDDGFLLVMPDATDLPRLVALARHLRERLVRPVALSRSANPADVEDTGTRWEAEIGIGVVIASPQTRAAQAISAARAMARTAWTYPSRIAWFDADRGQIAELPLDDPR